MMYAARAADSFISSSKTWLQVSWLVCAARVVALPGSREPAQNHEATHRSKRRRKLAHRHRLSTRESSVLDAFSESFAGRDAQAYFAVMN